MQLRINFRNCHSTKKPYNWIKPKVKRLVDAMNTVYGVKTMTSCQGHFSFSKNKPPYVNFKAQTVVAAQAKYLIRFEQVIGASLNFNWENIGRFDENYKLTFLLYSQELHDEHYLFFVRSSCG